MSSRILTIVNVLYDTAEQLSIKIPSFSELHKRYSELKNDVDEITEHDIYRFILEDLQEAFDNFLFNDPQIGLGEQQKTIAKPFVVSALNVVYLSNAKFSLLRFISKNTAKELNSIYFSDYKEDKYGKEYIDDREYIVYQGDGEALLKPLKTILSQLTIFLNEHYNYVRPKTSQNILNDENLKLKMLNEIQPAFQECGFEVDSSKFIDSLLLFLTLEEYDGLRLGSYDSLLNRSTKDKNFRHWFFYALFQASYIYRASTGSKALAQKIANYLEKCFEPSIPAGSMKTYISNKFANEETHGTTVKKHHLKVIGHRSL